MPAGNGASPSFSGFHAVRQAGPDDVSQEDLPMDSVLKLCAKLYSPVDEFSDWLNKNIADMVNHVFDISLQE